MFDIFKKFIELSSKFKQETFLHFKGIGTLKASSKGLLSFNCDFWK